MILIFNEASDDFEPPNEEIGMAWLEEFIEMCIQYHKRRHIAKLQIISPVRIDRLKIFNVVALGKWLESYKGNAVRRSIILSILKSNIIAPHFPPYYYCSIENKQLETKGIGHAIENDGYAIGYSCDSWSKPPIAIFKHTQSVVETIQFDRHLSCIHDVFYFFPQRKFEHHKKHDRKRLNIYDGESTLNYNPANPMDLELIQKMLDYAIPWGNGLCNYDYNKNEYIVFNAHGFRKFHAYHINETDVPDNIKNLCKDVTQKMKRFE